MQNYLVLCLHVCRTRIWTSLRLRHILSKRAYVGKSYLFRAILVWRLWFLALRSNKKFCEELIAYFPLVLNAQHKKRRFQKFYCCCVYIHCRGNVFTEPLSNNDKWDTHTHRARWSRKPTLILILSKRNWTCLHVHNKDYDRKGSVEKKISDRESQGAWREDKLIGGKLPVV
jgi:hypothetical protein